MVSDLFFSFHGTAIAIKPNPKRTKSRSKPNHSLEKKQSKLLSEDRESEEGEAHHTYCVLRTQPRFHGANARGCRSADSRRRSPTAVSGHSLSAAAAAPAHIVVSRTSRICSAPQMIRFLGRGGGGGEAEAFASLLCLGYSSGLESGLRKRSSTSVRRSRRPSSLSLSPSLRLCSLAVCSHRLRPLSSSRLSAASFSHSLSA